MKIIALITENFRVYYHLVSTLKEKGIPFLSLSPNDPIPQNAGVVITTTEEVSAISSENVVLIDPTGDMEYEVSKAVSSAQRILSGKEKYNTLIIGIDPGKRPGIAVIGDGEVVDTQQVNSPEDVISYMNGIVENYPAGEVKVRIGHGDITHRNRIINVISTLDFDIEIVDETSTTRRTNEPDIEAAISIAMTRGYPAKDNYEVIPTEGELRDIQRLSRLASDGRITISTELAEMVARGEFSIEAAIEKQKEKGREGD